MKENFRVLVSSGCLYFILKNLAYQFIEITVNNFEGLSSSSS